jgi:purine-binding chemotaxis protein CheW
MTDAQYCTFAVGGLVIGLEVQRVREVLSQPEVTPVPLAPPGVVGLLNLRGEIVTVIDARHRLGLPARGPDQDCSHVIVPTEGEVISLVVDSEGEVAELDPATAQPVPETIRPEIRRLLSSIFELSSGPLLLVLDADRGLSITPN